VNPSGKPSYKAFQARGASLTAATTLEVLDSAPGEDLRDFRLTLCRLAQDLRQLQSILERRPEGCGARSRSDAGVTDQINNLWQDHKDGRLTQEQVQRELLGEGGQNINPAAGTAHGARAARHRRSQSDPSACLMNEEERQGEGLEPAGERTGGRIVPPYPGAAGYTTTPRMVLQLVVRVRHLIPCRIGRRTAGIDPIHWRWANSSVEFTKAASLVLPSQLLTTLAAVWPNSSFLPSSVTAGCAENGSALA
jgi:hypothetical protein